MRFLGRIWIRKVFLNHLHTMETALLRNIDDYIACYEQLLQKIHWLELNECKGNFYGKREI